MCCSCVCWRYGPYRDQQQHIIDNSHYGQHPSLPPNNKHDTAESTVWLGLLVLLALLAPLCTTAALVLARNHWLAVALRYVVGVLLMRSSAGLRLRCLARCRPAQSAVAWAGMGLLAAVGALVAVYLATCYSVGGVGWGLAWGRLGGVSVLFMLV